MRQTTPLTFGGQSPTTRAALAGEHEPARSLYIHIPFCAHKCHYCDFYSIAGADDRQDAFLDALLLELAAMAPSAGPLETVFIGGGTPTLLRPDLWRRLLDTLHTRFDLRAIAAGRGEFTVECNPETADARLFEILRTGGVDRISLGAQSFDPALLRALERRHRPEKVGEALRLARDAGIARRSVDLIFAIPGQSVDAWRRDLDTALALDPGVGHVSAYALTYEPNTALHQRLRRGEFAPINEETEATMHEIAVERLAQAGFAQYEVSNFAHAGEGAGPSLHNLAYWRQTGWLAAGPSASGHLRTAQGGWRWRNAPRLGDWVDGVVASGGFAPVEDLEAPVPARALQEALMTGVRISEGVDETDALDQAGALGVRADLERAIDRCAARGWLSRDAGRVRPTPIGLRYADAMASDLMDAVSPARQA
ncbi:MAG: radical SAM family heme chaperone HemW [Phycisphaerales bacterium]